MPYALILKATCNEVVESLRSINGSQLQGAFLDLVRQVDPQMAAKLHYGDGLRPYGLSLLSPLIGQQSYKPITKVVLRVACVTDDIYPALLKVAVNGHNNCLHIGQADFHITQLISASEKEHDGVGFASYEDILWQAKQSNKNELINLAFITPTVFSQGSRGDMPLPLPEYVFGGLARRWNAIPNVPKIVPDNFITSISEYISVSRFKGKTVCVDIGDKLIKTGFIGTVTYRINDSATAFWCQLLARAALFTGLGGKTSRGMGYIRKI